MNKTIKLILILGLFFNAMLLVSCGEKEVEHTHSWDAGKVIKEATCTEDGEKEYKCTVCEETKLEKINKTEHVIVIDKAVEATCTKDGLTEGKHCSSCGETLVTQTVVSALGHNEVVDEAVSATCKQEGLTEGKHCSTCGEILKQQEVINKKYHDYKNGSCTMCNKKVSDGLAFEFNILQNGYLVTGIGTCKDENIIIPDAYDNFPVVSIHHDAFKNCKTILSVKIPASVNTIGNEAFYDCLNLKEVIFEEGSNLTSIGKSAFYNCTGLKSVKIPASVTLLDSCSFEDCTSLKEVIFEEGSKLENIETTAFAYCIVLEKIFIPSGVTNIGKEAFYWCPALKEVIFEEGSKLKTVGADAFYGCACADSLVFPNGIE